MLLQARFPATAARLFTIAFCFKVALFGVLHHRSSAPADVAGLLALAAGFLLVLTRRWSWYGVAILFVHRAGTLYTSWPFTLNHAFFEAWTLLFLTLFPSGVSDERGEVCGLAPSLIRATTSSVWFYAGIQKLVHGRYLNGEMLAVSGLFEGGQMLGSLGPVAAALERLGSAHAIALPLRWPASLEATELALPELAVAFVVASSVLIVLGELLLPVLVWCGGRARMPALVALIALQILIALLSRELSFGVTSTAALLLFAPDWARRAYPVLAAAIVASWAAILGGFR
jgi:hypothetical protein